jgi:gliding motility-associated-like protein
VKINNNWSNIATLTFNVTYCTNPTTTAAPQSCDIFVPEAFSPSNHDGIHDYFDVWGLICYPNHRMSIFDRAGNLLYRRTNDYPAHPWDGKVNGIIISDTRTWILEINGNVHSTGSVFVN